MKEVLLFLFCTMVLNLFTAGTPEGEQSHLEPPVEIFKKYVCGNKVGFLNTTFHLFCSPKSKNENNY